MPNTKGRIPKERQLILDWLQDTLAVGPARARYLKQNAPASWRTVERVKQELGVLTKRTKYGWIWYLSSINPELVSASSTPNPDSIQGHLLPDEEPEEDPPLYTAGMVQYAKFRNRQGDDEDEIERQLIKDCQQWPTNPPYPANYVKQVVYAVLYDKPMPAIPDGIDEPF